MSQQQTEKRSYKNTLNLPKSSFPMKANLIQNEPGSRKRWDQEQLYRKLREQDSGRPAYVFHDGPPYANGSIHLGHLLNKVLKDFVVRSKTMAGFNVPYIPGWDCHGLPIEHKVMEELGSRAREMEAIQIRRKCKTYAEKFVKLQSSQMQQLLTLADYDNPYLTMNPAYEAEVLDVFAALVREGVVYRGLKPVHWSIENRTALAEAELEYYDREDTSIYVFFDIVSLPRNVEVPAGKSLSLMIWTTTPWTLPANLAVAVHEQYEYGLYEMGDRLAVMAVDLAGKVAAAADQAAHEPIRTFKGGELLGTVYKHPFINRQSKVVPANYVTLEDGTGLVHTAPGHGVEDYQTGLKEGLDIYCPVQDDGTFDHTAPQWLQGKSVWDANRLVVDQLDQSGHMAHHHAFTHSYPHDWRGKTPVIFRATEQWFVSVDKPLSHANQSLRQLAMKVTESDIRFIPAWGRNRMRGMLESRPDWCLSRQRAWGLPIPAFYPPDGVTGEPLLTEQSVKAVANVIRKRGSDRWFLGTTSELLHEYQPDDDPDCPRWVKDIDNRDQIRKSSDIFDVWFESGSSWNAVMRRRGLARPDDDTGHTDLYLEGSDQHRGWFQLSLLPSLGMTGRTPFKTVLTHGFMVDKDGRKMSKSLGNTLEVDALLKQYGADVCRWWVSSLNTDNDIKVDEEFFRLAGEEYRKVRNTIKFLLSNLDDFDINRDKYVLTQSDRFSIDAWAVDELNQLIDVVTESYDQFTFRKVHESLFTFCNDTMSAVYLTATKDRLYCDPAGSPRRRRSQTVMYHIADSLIRLAAPILPHTADEAWRSMHGDVAGSVHLTRFPEPLTAHVSPDWQSVMQKRDQWLKVIEESRQSIGIDNPLDCGLVISRCDLLDQFDPIDLADLCSVSRVTMTDETDTVRVDSLIDQPRCERSWKRDGTVRQRSDGGMLSDRDAEALGIC